MKKPNNTVSKVITEHRDLECLLTPDETTARAAEYSHNTLATGWVKKGFKGENGFLTLNGAIVPVKKVKLERCKSCGQNDADYSYSNGIFTCNYCGSLSGEVKPEKQNYLIEQEIIPLNINEARIKLGYPPLPNAPDPNIKCR